MPQCHNAPKAHYKGTEPSPKGRGYCARAEKVGTRKIGTNRKYWVVRAHTVNGKKVKRWVPVKQTAKKVAKKAAKPIKKVAVKKARCHNAPKAYYTGTEPSPKGRGYCARAEKVGTRKIGTNRKYWVVRAHIVNGKTVKRWVPIKQTVKKVAKKVAKKVVKKTIKKHDMLKGGALKPKTRIEYFKRLQKLRDELPSLDEMNTLYEISRRTDLSPYKRSKLQQKISELERKIRDNKPQIRGLETILKTV